MQNHKNKILTLKVICNISYMYYFEIYLFLYRFKGEKISGHNSRSNEDIGWRFGIAIDGSGK